MKYIIPIKKPERGYKYMSLSQMRDGLANLVARRFCLDAYNVRKWINKNKLYNLNKIIPRTKDFEKFLSEIINI